MSLSEVVQLGRGEPEANPLPGVSSTPSIASSVPLLPPLRQTIAFLSSNSDSLGGPVIVRESSELCSPHLYLSHLNFVTSALHLTSGIVNLQSYLCPTTSLLCFLGLQICLNLALRRYSEYHNMQSCASGFFPLASGSWFVHVAYVTCGSLKVVVGFCGEGTQRDSHQITL